jgi:hypothetical protein
MVETSGGDDEAVGSLEVEVRRAMPGQVTPLSFV